MFKTGYVLFLGLLLSGFGANALADEKVDSISKTSFRDGIVQLSAQYELTEYSLPLSKSLVRVPPGFILLRGEAARQRLFLTQGTQSPDVEAVLFNSDTETQLILSYVEAGQVSMRDWTHLEPDHLIGQITQVTLQKNPERRKHHLPEWYVRGWLQKPTLLATGHAVSWMVDLKVDGERRVLGTAINLGRYGYEKLVWSAPHHAALVSEEWLDQLLTTHAFGKGRRYSDHLEGDPSAGFGIASLVAVNATGTPKTEAGSTTWFAALITLGQEPFFIPILIGLGTLGAFFRELILIKLPNPLKISDR